MGRTYDFGEQDTDPSEDKDMRIETHVHRLCIRLLTGPCYEANEAPMALLS